MEDLQPNHETERVLRTGIPALDSERILLPGTATAICSGSGEGKTALAVKIAFEAAVNGCRVVFFSSNETETGSLFDLYRKTRCATAADKDKNGLLTVACSRIFSSENPVSSGFQLMVFDDEPKYKDSISTARQCGAALITTVGTKRATGKGPVVKPSLLSAFDNVICTVKTEKNKFLEASVVKSRNGTSNFSLSFVRRKNDKDGVLYPIGVLHSDIDDNAYYSCLSDGSTILDEPRLKPCPFCGCGATVMKEKIGYSSTGPFSAREASAYKCIGRHDSKCIMSFVSMPYLDSAAAAAEKWNFRITD